MKNLSPNVVIESPGNLAPVRTHIFNFEGFAIIASIVRPDEDVIHVGGTHTDSPFPQQKWPSLDAAIEKVTAKAQDMEAKCRIQELPYAGCKLGIFVADTTFLRGPRRIYLFQRLGEVLNHYNGQVYTGADVNTDLFDLIATLTVSTWVLGKPQNYGGCGDPSAFTGDTIVRIHKGLMPLIAPRSPAFRGKKITIRGAAGKVGRHILRGLYQEGASLAIADINVEGREELRNTYPGVEILRPHDIHTKEAHIFCPADSTVTLPDRNTVDELRCNAIIGPANDQNRTPEFEDVLFERGILHPSMNGALENGAGLLAVADELEKGGFSRERLEGKIAALVAKTVAICQESLTRRTPPCRIIEERYLRR